MREDGTLDVLNECRKESHDGPLKTAKGRGRIVDSNTNAKLKVTFFWPFHGDYWIIDLDEEYRYAVVGHPRRKYLWILSRTPFMDDAIYHRIVERLHSKKGTICRN